MMRRLNLRNRLVWIGLLAAVLVVFVFSSHRLCSSLPVPCFQNPNDFGSGDLRPIEPALVSLVHSGWKPIAALDEVVTPLGTRICSGRRVICSSVEFTSQVWHGERERIFGYYAAPAEVVTSGTKVPALLLVHGGGGQAVLGQVAEAASKGFAALAIDLPGKGWHRDESRSTGLDMTVENIFQDTGDPQDNYLFHASIAAMRSITFLTRRDEVDPSRIGLFGVSWGGVIGLLTTAVDHRVSCFVDAFGSGYIPVISCWKGFLAKKEPGDLARWSTDFDPSQYLSKIRVPVLAVTGTNDACYPLPIFQRTLNRIQPPPSVSYSANLNHQLDKPTRAEVFSWFHSRLIALDLREDEIRDGASTASTDFEMHGKSCNFSVHAPCFPGESATLVFGPANGSSYTFRKWKSVRLVWNSAARTWTGSVGNLGSRLINYTVRFRHNTAAICTKIRACAVVDGKNGLVACDMPYMHVDLRFVQAYLADRADADHLPNDDAFWDGFVKYENSGAPPQS